MDAIALAKAAASLIEFGLRTQQALNEGDLEQAKAHLKAARTHFDHSVAGWQAAGKSPDGVVGE